MNRHSLCNPHFCLRLIFLSLFAAAGLGWDNGVNWQAQYAVAFVDESGTVRAMGHPTMGGIVPPSPINNMKSLYSTNHAFAALLNDGSVVAWGDSSAGGRLDVALTNVVKICANRDAFYALKSDGTVYGWGNKLKYGSLHSPPDIGNIVDIYTSEIGVAAILSNGNVAIWGDESKNTVKPNSDIVGVKALCVGSMYYTAVYGDNGNVATFGSTDLGISAVSASLVGVEQVSCAYDAAAALTEGGRVIVWGASESPSGDNTISKSLSNIKTIYNNYYAFAALDRTGKVFCWGGAKALQGVDVGGACAGVSSPTGSTNVKYIVATERAFAALHHDGSVSCWGNKYYRTDKEVSTPVLQNIVLLHAHVSVICALSGGGKATCWGNELYGANIPEYVPDSGLIGLASSEYSMVAISNQSFAYMWGYINTCCAGQPTILSSVSETYGFLSNRAISSFPNTRVLYDNSVPYPSGQPTSSPTTIPTDTPTATPTSAPSSSPTFDLQGLSLQWSHAGALNESAFRQGRGIMFMDEYRFTGLGHPTNLFLTLDVYDTGFGPPHSGQFVEFEINGRSVKADNTGLKEDVEEEGGNWSDNLKCAPRGTVGDTVYCTDSYVTCAYNIDVTNDIQPQFGGSLLVSSISHGVLSSACPYRHGDKNKTISMVYVRFRLAVDPVKTPGPTSQPSPSPTRPYIISGLQLSFDSMDVWELLQISFSIGLLLGCFAAALCVVRNKSKTVHKFPVAYATIRTGLLGVELCSMIFLIVKLIRSPFSTEGIILACFRLLQVLVGAFILLCIYGKDSDAVHQYSNLRLLPFIDEEHLVTESKVYTAVSIMCLIDCAFIAFLPWRESRFSMMSKGFPVMWVWRVANATIIASVFVSLGCQMPYLFKSEAFDIQQDLIFVINISLLILKLLIVSVEYHFKSHVLAGTESQEDDDKTTATTTTTTTTTDVEGPAELGGAADIEMTENPLAVAAHQTEREEDQPLLHRRLEALEGELRGVKGVMFDSGLLTKAKRASVAKVDKMDEI